MSSTTSIPVLRTNMRWNKEPDTITYRRDDRRDDRRGDRRDDKMSNRMSDRRDTNNRRSNSFLPFSNNSRHVHHGFDKRGETLTIDNFPALVSKSGGGSTVIPVDSGVTRNWSNIANDFTAGKVFIKELPVLNNCTINSDDYDEISLDSNCEPKETEKNEKNDLAYQQHSCKTYSGRWGDYDDEDDDF